MEVQIDATPRNEFSMEGIPFDFTPVKDKELELHQYQEEVKETIETKETEESKDDLIKGEIKPKTPEEIKQEEEDLQKQREEFYAKGNQTEEISEETPTENPLKIIAEELQAKGIITLGEEYKIESDEDFLDIFQKNIEQGVQNSFEARFENHPQKEKAKALFEYIENGGDIDKFTEAYANPLSFIDLSTEIGQEKVVQMRLKSTTRLSDDKIKEKITKLKDAALLEEEAKEAFEEMSLIQKENEILTLEQQKEAARLQKEETKKVQDEMREFIRKNDSIKGIIDIKSTKDKQLIEEYLFKPTVKIGNQLVSKYVADNENESIEDFLAIVALKAKGFDFKKLEKQAEVKVKQKLAEKLNSFSKDSAKIKGEGRVREEDVLKGKVLTQEEKNKLWENQVIFK